VDSSQLTKGPAAVEPVAAHAATVPFNITSLGIASYPTAVLLDPDGRTLRLPLSESESLPAGHSIQGPIQVAALRKLLRSAIESPRRDELLQYLLRGHSIVLVVEGTDRANNQRAGSWAQDAIERVRDAMPAMAKPIALPPRMIRLSPQEAQHEQVLLWSLGVGLVHKDPRAQEGKGPRPGKFLKQPPGYERVEASVAQIALLFGRGRKLGPVLRIPGSRQQDLWRSLGVVGEDCECGLDRSWMRGPMIPHAWSTTDEAEAVAALGFDPGNPLVKAEISRILVRGPWLAQGAQADGVRSSGARQPLQDPLQPQLQLMEIDIDALAAAADGRDNQSISSHSQAARDTPLTSGKVPPTSEAKQLDRLSASHRDILSPETGAPETGAPGPKLAMTSLAALPQLENGQAAENPRDGTSAARGAITWVLVALALVGVLGSLIIFLLGRRKQV